MKKAILYFLILICSIAVAQENNDLYNLSLEELMNVKVVTASKTSEEIVDAPGIVTVITSEEIDRYGANNLAEVLERVTSCYITGSHLFPQNVVAFRGDLLSHYTNHVLILLNDRPLTDSYSGGGVMMPILTAFPLASIDRIEIIRGPGSVLYGTNAFSGVIHIITKDSEKTEVSGEAVIGSFGSSGLSMNTMLKEEKSSLHMFGTTFRKEGWEFNAVDPTFTDSSMLYGEDYSSTFLEAQFKDYKVSSMLSHNIQDFVGGVFRWNSTTPLNTRKMKSTRGFTDISREFKISDNFTVKPHLTYNHMSFDYYSYASFANDFMGEVMVNSKLRSNLNLVFGVSSTYQTFGSKEGTNSAPVANGNNYVVRNYFQLNYKPIDKVQFTGGGQFRLTRDLKPVFVPRLAAIGKITKNLGLKALYGEAYRAPFAQERNFDLVIYNEDGSIRGGLKGDPLIMAERINSLNFEIYYQDLRRHFSLTYFNTKMNDLMTRERASDNIVYFVNKGELYTQGLEFYSKISLTKKLLFNLNGSYQENHDGSGVYNYTPAPNTMIKGGLSYKFNSLLTLSVFNSYIGDAPDIIVTSPDRLAYNPASKAYNLMTGKVTVSLKELFKIKDSLKDINFSLYGYNLLNEKIYHPEIAGKSVNTIPGRSPLGIYGKLKFSL